MGLKEDKTTTMKLKENMKEVMDKRVELTRKVARKVKLEWFGSEQH